MKICILVWISLVFLPPLWAEDLGEKKSSSSPAASFSEKVSSEKTPAWAKPTERDSSGFWWAFLSVGVLMAGILWVRKFLPQPSASKDFQMISQMPLSSHQKLVMVRVRNKCLLLAVNKDNIQFLMEMTDDFAFTGEEWKEIQA